MGNLLPCTHERNEIRRKVDAANRPFFKRQCLDCGGAVGESIKHSLITGNPLDWDKELEDRHVERVHVVNVADKDQRRREWWQQYAEYMESEIWAEKRDRVLERDQYLCQACRKRQANEVHHLTYKHFGDEPLFELISVCTPCHRKITKMDREHFDPFASTEAA